MRIKTIILLISFFVLLGTKRTLAQDKTMYLMGIQPQENILNPAFYENNSFLVLSLSGYAYYDNSSLTVNDMLTTRTENGTKNTYWDFETIDKKLRDENFINIGAGTTPLFIGYNLKESTFLNFSISINNSGYIKLPETISQLRFGNADLENNTPRTIDLNHYGINEISYVQYSFGISKKLSKNFNIGLHVKFLTGISAIRTNRFLASVETSDDFSESLLTTNIQMDVSGPLFESDKLTNVFRQQLGLGEFIAGKGSSSIKNFGTAFDFGFNWELNDRIKLHGAINDLGIIRWEKKPQMLISKGEFLYDGIQFTPYNLADEDFSFNDYLQQYADTVLATIIPTTVEESFSTQLYTKTYLGLTYKFSDKLHFDALINSTLNKDATLKRATLGATYAFNSSISLTSSLSYSNFWLYNIGMGILIKKERFQYYLVTDNINAVDLRNTRALNFAFGINYWLRNKNDSKKDLE